MIKLFSFVFSITFIVSFLIGFDIWSIPENQEFALNIFSVLIWINLILSCLSLLADDKIITKELLSALPDTNILIFTYTIQIICELGAAFFLIGNGIILYGILLFIIGIISMYNSARLQRSLKKIS